MIWKCKYCSEELTVKDGNLPLFCPACGQKQEETAPSSSGTSEGEDSAADEAAEKTQDVAEHICPVCCTKIENDDEVHICPHCGIYHHKECWDENQGCASYGCPSSPRHDGHDEASHSVDWKPCPWCHTLLPVKTMICSSCGRRTDEVPSSSQLASKLGTGFFDGLSVIREKLLLLWKDFTPLALAILQHYKHCLRLYASFSGEDTRKDFMSYLFMTVIISWILTALPGNMVLACLYWSATILPTAAAVVRRLKNAGMSPWFCIAFPLLPLLLLVPKEEKQDQNK